MLSGAEAVGQEIGRAVVKKIGPAVVKEIGPAVVEESWRRLGLARSG